MLTTGQVPQNFGLILGFRTSILPMTSPLFLILAANPIPLEEAAIMLRLPAQGTLRPLEILSTVLILEPGMVDEEVMDTMLELLVNVPEVAMILEGPHPRILRPSITTST